LYSNHCSGWPWGAGNAIHPLKRGNDRHTCFHLGHDSHSPGLANFTLGLSMDIAQVANDNVQSPSKPTPAVMDTRLEQISFWNISGREPTHYRDQANRPPITVQPQLQGVLFVADIKTGVARL
jgi:hypothetical protein